MKTSNYLFLSLLICLPLVTNSQGSDLLASLDPEKAPAPHVRVFLPTASRGGSVPARFPAGDRQLVSRLEKQIAYPEMAYTHGMDGIVLVRLYISPSGVLQDLQLIRKAGFNMDEVVLEALSRFTQWQPASSAGRPVASTLDIQVRFSLLPAGELQN
jgi:TonB family protein